MASSPGLCGAALTPFASFTKHSTEGAYNPVLRVKAPAKPRAVPRAIDYETIYTTLNQMEPSATKAFLMIMASFGFRPSEIKRTEPWMIRLDGDEPHVVRNTAQGGDVVVV